MAKPVILAVDDDLEVLHAVERDLRRHYGREYRVLSADRGEKALEALNQLRLRANSVALFLVDQRMPGLTGVEFLERATGLYPEAKRVLLTAYADTSAAIRAINEVHLDHYLLKPWEPPEERLYPVLSDLLDDWQANHHPPFEGLRVLGNRWSPRSHELKDFLGSSLVPYQWLDVELSEEGKALLAQLGSTVEKLPVVLFPDGTWLTAPSTPEVAEKLGLNMRAKRPFYDLVILGGGPAGLAAAVYGASEGLSTVMVERAAPGGQAGTSSRIENYLGFPSGLTGADLTRRAVAQAQRFGVEILNPQQAVGLRVEDPYRFVRLADGGELSCHALLIATGVSWRRLEAPGIERLTGAGVYYGAARTEALACQNEDVFIVGGANSAGQSALYFAQFARKVSLVVRGGSLEKGMSQYLVEQVRSTPNISVEFHTRVVAAEGDSHLERLTLATGDPPTLRTVPTTSLFIMIGATPETDWLDGQVLRDERGYLLTGPDLMRDGQRPRGWRADRDPYLLETSVPGVFAAGDVRHASIKRVASGVGEGSIAISFIHQYLGEV